MEVLSWGGVTPESANLKENRFCYVINHDISSEEKIERTIRFIAGRLNYYDKHLPENPIHELKIDIRGQFLDDLVIDNISKRLKELYYRPLFLTIFFVK